MSSIFQYARQTTDEEPEEINPIFSEVKSAKQDNIIPPVGIAKPELVESFTENMGDEDKIREAIREAERYENENFAESSLRETLAHSARAAEGFFGGINQFLNFLTPELYENEEGMPYEPGQQPQGLPGPEGLHEVTKKFTGKYLEPKSEFTKTSQETFSDIGTMFSSLGLSKIAKVLLPVGGQVTKQAIKSSGGSERAQDFGKYGFMTLASIANLGNAPKAASQALNQTEQMLPRGLSFSAKPTEQAFKKIKNSSWFKSGSTPSKAPAMAELERIEAAIKNGKIDAHMAMQLRRDINEARKQLGGFQLNKPVNKKQALKYLDEVDNALVASMENFGTNVNPQWWKNYKFANEAYKITQRSRLISDLVQQYAKPLQSETAKILLHVGGGAALTKLPALGAAAFPVIGAAKTIQIMNRMIRSSVLRNHYLNVLKQASLGNSAATMKAIEKFDIASKKLEGNQ